LVGEFPSPGWSSGSHFLVYMLREFLFLLFLLCLAQLPEKVFIPSLDLCQMKGGNIVRRATLTSRT